MISSMTGFGRGEESDSRQRVTVEMRSVNNRYLDLNIRLPRKFAALENRIRDAIKSSIVRGKVDVFVTRETYGEGDSCLCCNEELAADYVRTAAKVGKTLGIDGTLTMADLSRIPDIFKMEEGDADEVELWNEIKGPLDQAISAFCRSRAEEGEKLKKDLLGKLDGMAVYASEIEKREPQIVEEYRARLLEKVKEVLEDRTVDDSLIASEVVIYADRICTDEETVRLKSHIGAMAKELRDGGAVGRKLDFLAQEMNREANTILSKATDLETSNIGIALKTDIEKVREQIQNIE